MKHIRLFMAFLVTTSSLFSAYAQGPSNALTSRMKQTWASARSFARQKTACMINYDSCTDRDKVLISNTFGFLLGYGITYRPLIDRALEKIGVRTETPLITFRSLFIISLASAFAQEVGLTGPLFTKRGTGFITNFLHRYSLAPNKDLFLANEQRLLRLAGSLGTSLLLLLVAMEAFAIMKEALYAFQYEKQSPLISISRYLKMNAGCIWNVANCRPQENAEQRRVGLYFWLGYIQGRVAREVKQRFF